MLSNIEEFFHNLDKKIKIAIYFLIFLAGIFIYYTFNYSYLEESIKENNKKIKHLQSKLLFSPKHYFVELKNLTQKYKKLQKKEFEARKDLEYLNTRVDISPLNIDDEKFYSLLEEVLAKASELNLNANFYMDKNFIIFKSYVIDIDGKVRVCEEKKLFDFIKFLESTHYITSINKFILDKNSSHFFIDYKIWGIK